MKKYFEIDCDLDEEDIEEALGEWCGRDFKVREIPKIDILTHENIKCNNSKVIADGNKGMKRG